MKKIAILSLSVALLYAPATSVPAQKAEVDIAGDEAVRRQAHKEDLKRKLVDAAAAQKKGAFLESAQMYTDSLELVKKVGTGVEAEHKQALAGFTETRLQLAESAQRAGNYGAADDQYRSILKHDANNPIVQELWKKNEALRLASAGRMPSEDALNKMPAAYTNRIQASTLVQNGKLFYEASKLDEAEVQLKQALKLDPSNQAAAYYLNLVKERRNKIAVMRHSEANNERLLKIEEAWTPAIKRELPVPNMYARTNQVNTSKGRQRIIHKLDTIMMGEISYDGLPLNSVIETLNKDAKTRDPDKKGLNFVINPFVDPLPPGAPVIDPVTGTATAAPPAADDIGQATVRIVPPLNELSLRQVLDVIVKVASPPVKYSIEDYAVVFSWRAPETPLLHTRLFKIDPNTFMQGLQGVTSSDFGVGSGGSGGGGSRSGGGGSRSGGGGGSRGGQGGGGQNGGQGGSDGGASFVGVTLAPSGGRGGQQQGGGQQPRQPGTPGTLSLGGAAGVDHLTVVTFQDQLATLARQFFTTAGVDLSTPGKSVFFNDRSGMLMVRATLQDLDLIEQAIQVLNMAPPLLTIDTKFIEITQEDVKALGFDWFLGNTLARNGSIGTQGGSAPSFGSPETSASAANPNGTFPGPSLINAIPPSSTDNLLTSGLRNGVNAPALATVTGILTDPQFRVVIKALEQRQGVDVLVAPRVTTISARQAQIKVVEVRYIVTDLDLGGAQNQNTQVAGVGGTTVQNTGASIQPLPEPFELGPVLDVLPYVSADGYTIQMTIIPTIKDFVGYDLESARLFTPQIQTSQGGNPLTTTTPLPIFRLRQVVTSAIVWDGQTVVIGGLIGEDTTKIKDKVPILGDLPFVGRLFRSESSSMKKKNIVIFVTPTIIDPAGNRVHSEEEMPFAQGSVPAQTPVNP